MIDQRSIEHVLGRNIGRMDRWCHRARDGRVGPVGITRGHFVRDSTMIQMIRWWGAFRLCDVDSIAVGQRLKMRLAVFVAFPSFSSSYLFLLAVSGTFDPVTTLNHVGFQADRSWSSVELQEEATGVAQHRADFISSPQRSGQGGAILTYRLQILVNAVSKCCHVSGCDDRNKTRPGRWWYLEAIREVSTRL